ncbi:MAG: hypothetical protein NC253_10415 [Ruminococcus sp.]|nr:hypothetical protein [Ruminococcus sp.]
MTSKVSNKRKSPVLHNFECGVKSNIRMAVIIFILHMVAAPAVIFAAIVTLYSKGDVDGIIPFAVIGVATTAVAGFMGVLIAIDSFSCLHNKSVVDMRFSLPLTADQRFVSNFLSGLAVYIVPFLAAQVFSLIGMGYGLAFMDGRTFKRIAYWSSDGTDQYTEYVCHYFSEFMPMLLKVILAGILTMLMLYTLTVLVTVCCGSKFESIAYTLLINAAIPLTVYLGYSSMFMNLFGLDVSDAALHIIMCTSPVGGIYTAIEWATGESLGVYPMNHGVWAVIFFLLTAAMGAGAFLLYRKRRAEQVSKPFVFKALYYIITSLAIFCIYSAFYAADEYDNIVAAFLTTAIVYFILEVIANRGFRKIWLSIFKYAGVMICSVLIVIAAQKTEGFGMVTRVPDVSQVSYAEIEYSGFYDRFYLPYGYNEETGVYEQTLLKFSETENIETIINAHQTAVDNRNGEYRASVTGGFNVTYHLKNGSTMKRHYDSLPAEEAEIMSRLDITEEYKTQIAEMYSREILKTVEDYENSEKYNPEYAANRTVNLQTENGIKSNAESGVRISTLIKKNFFEQLAAAYSKDIMSITDENYFRSDLKNVYYLTGIYRNITVPENFANTMELLEYFGFNAMGKEDVPFSEVISYLEDAAREGNLSVMTAAEWRKVNSVPEGTRLHSDYFFNHTGGEFLVTTVTTNLYDLYMSAEPMNIVPENGYIIYVFGNTGLIPEELNGVAERVCAGRAKDETQYDENVNPIWSVAPTEEIDTIYY